MSIPKDTGLGQVIHLLEANPSDRAIRVERAVLEKLCNETLWLAEENAEGRAIESLEDTFWGRLRKRFSKKTRKK